MAINERTIDDKIEITGEYKLIQIRQSTIIERYGVEISRSFSRRIVTPLDDVSGESAEIKALAAVLHTDEIKSSYRAHIKAQK